MASSKDIYVIQHPLGPVKIGIADRPRERLGDIQIGCPFELKIRKTKTVPEPRDVENYLHMYFRRHHMNGEWFDLPPDKRDFPIPSRISAGTPDVEMDVLGDTDFEEQWVDSLNRTFREFRENRSLPANIREIRDQCDQLLDQDEQGQSEQVSPPSSLTDIAEEFEKAQKRCSSCGHLLPRDESGCPTCGSGATFETDRPEY